MRFGEYPPQGSAVYDATDGMPEHAAVQPAGSETIRAARSEADVLAALGFSKPLIAEVSARALTNGTSLEAELLRSGEVREGAYYGAIARLLRLPFIETIDAALVRDDALNDTQLIRPTMIRLSHRNRAPQTVIVPEAGRLADLAAALVTMPVLGRDLAITTPTVLRQAIWSAGEARRARDVANSLFESRPLFSARPVLTGQQGFCAGTLVAGVISCLLMAPLATLLFLHVTLSFLYLSSLILRIAAFAIKMRQRPSPPPRPAPLGQLPRYTVMVALYREASIVRQLVTSLLRLDWPATLLDIKLVCEADDTGTIAALKACHLPPQFEIIRVPPIGPRTKPKALTYALAAARGDYLAIYDAEDRPHPQQLREAYATFHDGAPDLVCLQAPLIIGNARETFLSGLFSLEYSALFRGLLPMLAKGRMPLPLGGTSNHFKTAILRQVGGWDPFNVTEDADIGLRLFRLGYRSGVINRQTMEDAPVDIPVWMAQRARWFKGWLQTWLVLMRQPVTLAREMGFLPFLIFQLTVGGMLLSALLHPLIFIFLWLGASALMEAPRDDLPLGTLSLFIMDFVNIIGSYLIFLGLGVGSMTDHEKRMLGRKWIFVPFYWLLISAASWRALIELKTKPFHWNKTPHRPTAKPSAAAISSTTNADGLADHSV